MMSDAPLLFLLGLAVGYIPSFIVARLNRGSRVSWSRIDYAWLAILATGIIPQVYSFQRGIDARELPVKSTMAVDRRIEAKNWALFVVRDCQQWSDNISARINAGNSETLPQLVELWKQQLAAYAFARDWFTIAADLLDSDEQAYRWKEYLSDGSAVREYVQAMEDNGSAPSWLTSEVDTLSSRVKAAVEAHDEYLETYGHGGPSDTLMIFLLFSFLLFGLSIGLRLGKVHATIQGLASRDP